MIMFNALGHVKGFIEKYQLAALARCDLALKFSDNTRTQCYTLGIEAYAPYVNGAYAIEYISYPWDDYDDIELERQVLAALKKLDAAMAEKLHYV